MAAVDYRQKEDVTKRVRFYDGQFLQAQDFVDEQAYHADRQWRHNRTLHVSGVVEGLAVAIEGGNVKVAAGTAVDADGRQIVLPNPVTAPQARPGYVYVAYRQAASDNQQAEEGVSGETRWLETPYVFFHNDKLSPGDSYPVSDDASTEVDSFQYRQPPPVLLARLREGEGGELVVDEGERRYSGLRLPGPGGAGQAAVLRSDAEGNVSLSLTRPDGTQPRPALTVTRRGRVGLGTQEPQAALDLQPTLEAAAGEGEVVGLRIAPDFSKLPSDVGRTALKVTGGDVEIGGSLTVEGQIRTNQPLSTNGVLILGEESGHEQLADLPNNSLVIDAHGSGELDNENYSDISFYWRDRYGRIREHQITGNTPGWNRGPACPYVYSYDGAQEQWRFDTTIIYKLIGAESEAYQRRPLQRFDGRLMIREEEPEISYLDEVYVVATHADGRETILRPDFGPLRQADGDYHVLREGDELLLTFPGYQESEPAVRFWVVARGYYIPLEEELNAREVAATA